MCKPVTQPRRHQKQSLLCEFVPGGLLERLCRSKGPLGALKNIKNVNHLSDAILSQPDVQGQPGSLENHLTDEEGRTKNRSARYWRFLRPSQQRAENEWSVEESCNSNNKNKTPGGVGGGES